MSLVLKEQNPEPLTADVQSAVWLSMYYVTLNWVWTLHSELIL